MGGQYEMPEAVECHSGYAYGERPIAFQWEGRRLIVAEVLAAWRLPDGREFRLRTEDGRVFELSYSEPDDVWRVRLV